MGARGPVPDREDNLARPRERQGKDEQSVKRGELRPLTDGLFEADPEWGQFAKNVWAAGLATGMADFYQDTDVAQLWFMCQELDRYVKPKVNASGEEYVKQSPEMVKALTTLMTNLGFSEGDRRRVRIELTAPEPRQDDAVVLAIASYKDMLDQ